MWAIWGLGLCTQAWAGSGEVAADEAPKGCKMCLDWNLPQAPFRLFGDSFYVGPAGLSSVVVDTGEGLVLLDGGLPESVAGIVASLETLGLSVADVRFLLVSHAHYDHVGGVAALQRRSGAVVVATEAAAAGLRAGNVLPGDPQEGFGADVMSFPPVTGPIQTLAHGETLKVGKTTFTLHATPGHTAGGATYTWQSCEKKRCASVVYADSLNAVSADGFRYTDDPAALEAFRKAIATVHSLDCDVLVAVHPTFGPLFAQAEASKKRGTRAFLDANACRTYAEDATARLDKRLAKEREP